MEWFASHASSVELQGRKVGPCMAASKNISNSGASWLWLWLRQRGSFQDPLCSVPDLSPLTRDPSLPFYSSLSLKLSH
ncbi:hypothetical protein RIF29_31268 [Crotalaria pallida]|uniref:Uncharacterized protein n=1 Tax=Crotalaria pallida TaxID=3830 RepID=A0AAN9EH11_CROPI